VDSTPAPTGAVKNKFSLSAAVAKVDQWNTYVRQHKRAHTYVLVVSYYFANFIKAWAS
jgi:hypothetical protein